MNLYLRFDGCSEEEYIIVDDECEYIDGKCYKNGIQIEDTNYMPEDPFMTCSFVNDVRPKRVRKND